MDNLEQMTYKKFKLSFLEEYKQQEKTLQKESRRVFSNDCRTSGVVFRNMLAFDSDDMDLYIGGCNRGDCLPCSQLKAKQIILYVNEVTKNGRSIIMNTFTIRHEEPMDREKFRKVLLQSFKATMRDLTNPRMYYESHQISRYKDHSSYLNGRYQNMSFLKFTERHENGYLHIHMLTDAWIPVRLLGYKFQNYVEYFAKRHDLLSNMPQYFLDRGNELHVEDIVDNGDGRVVPMSTSTTVYRKRNAHVHVVLPKMAGGDIKSNLSNYLTKMSEHDLMPKIKSTKDFKRRIIASRLAGYLSKDTAKRQHAVELALKYPYNHLFFLTCRRKTMLSRSKGLELQKSGLGKRIGFCKPGVDIREYFIPDKYAVLEENIPSELFDAIPKDYPSILLHESKGDDSEAMNDYTNGVRNAIDLSLNQSASFSLVTPKSSYTEFLNSKSPAGIAQHKEKLLRYEQKYGLETSEVLKHFEKSLEGHEEDPNSPERIIKVKIEDRAKEIQAENDNKDKPFSVFTPKSFKDKK